MLTIIRDTPTTNPLITFIERAYPVYALNEQTLEYNYRASDLQEIIITNDQSNFNNSLVEIQMTQKVFKCLVSELDINDSGIFADIATLRAALAAVFPDTNTGGGGGGTTDNSTPIHVIYKDNDGTFRDTAMTYDVGVDLTEDFAVQQYRNMTDGVTTDAHKVEHNTTATTHMFAVLGVLQKFSELKKLNSDTDESFTFILGQGQTNIFFNKDGVANYMSIGDVNGLDADAPNIFMDETDKAIVIKAGRVVLNPTLSDMRINNLPTYANNAAALIGGLVVDNIYKTATGELRIVI